MTQDRLRELLARLRGHLSTSDAVDAESRRQLGGVTRDIEHVLGRGAADPADSRATGVAERLEALSVRFEAGHPALAETLREIIDALAKAGI
jgi:Domain of unknown function (DUF4404)